MGRAVSVVNSRIRVRDQEAGPAAPDIKRVLREISHDSEQYLGLIVDVMGAHRLIPVRKEDWKYQACRLEDDNEVFVNTVGKFGIASASYWWSRAAGAFARLVHCVVQDRARFWLLLFADDTNVMAAGHQQVARAVCHHDPRSTS